MRHGLAAVGQLVRHEDVEKPQALIIHSLQWLPISSPHLPLKDW